MRVLLLNGSRRKNGCTYTALQEVAGVLNKEGIETEIMHAVPDKAVVAETAEKLEGSGRSYYRVTGLLGIAFGRNGDFHGHVVGCRR